MSEGPGQIPLFDAPRTASPASGEEPRSPGEGPFAEPFEASPAPEGSGEELPDSLGTTDAPPGSSMETAVPVSVLNAGVRTLLEASYPPLWVVGEVANWTRAGSGHCYFTLRDESAQISCVMWRRHADRLPTEPEEGMEVCAHGQISLYEARGTYQLMARKLEARGEGLWRLAFERLRRKLAAEGLLDEERKRPLPRVPLTVGVATSRTAAALGDVLTVIGRRAPWTRVVLSHCRVQGEGAAAEIAGALERLARHGGLDVIVLTRGGGSVEDLWAYNEEEVARAVAASPIPVISAVGHEVDVTIADLVADARAPTPSAAAELAVPDGAALRDRLRRLAGALVEGLRDRGRRRRDQAERAGDRLVKAVERRMERGEERLERAGGRLHALSPLAVLSRGYAVPTDEEGRVLRRVDDFVPGDPFRLRVTDGRVRARTEASEELGSEEARGRSPGTADGDGRSRDGTYPGEEGEVGG